MKVKEIMTTEVITVDKNVDVKYVMKLMKKHDITKIPVLEEKELIGLITDSNLTVKLGAIHTRGIPAARLHASSVMDKDIHIVSPEDDVSKILRTVGEPGPTMLCVVNKEGHLLGVVTKADLLPIVKGNQIIEEIMIKAIHTVSPEDRVIHARRILIDERIGRLPVVNNGILIGIISDIDIANALAVIKKSFPQGKQKHHLEELLVNDVMNSPVLSINADKTVNDAAEIMLKSGIGCLPVIKNEKIVGIISRTDLLKTITF